MDIGGAIPPSSETALPSNEEEETKKDGIPIANFFCLHDFLSWMVQICNQSGVHFDLKD